MARTKQEVQAFLRELSLKVKSGAISKSEATRLAVLAVSEVAPTPAQPEPPAKEGKAADEQPKEEPKEPAEAPKPAAAPSFDPKNQLITLLTNLENQFGAAWQDFQRKVTALLQQTEGAAVPLGDYTVTKGGRLDHNIKLKVDQVDQANVEITYTTRREWKVGGLTLPQMTGKQESNASVEPACHLPLRKELLAIADDIVDHTDSALSWKKYRLPVTDILAAREGAKRENDVRLGEILAGIPAGDDFNCSKAWKTWANAAQIMLLGNDYAVGKNFTQIVAEVKE
jgi:hypothetical protein